LSEIENENNNEFDEEDFLFHNDYQEYRFDDLNDLPLIKGAHLNGEHSSKKASDTKLKRLKSKDEKLLADSILNAKQITKDIFNSANSNLSMNVINSIDIG
jgi:hypothetical protein